MKHCYIHITEAFAQQIDGTVKGCNTLRTVITNDGRHVVSANALNVFPELFEERYRVTTLFLTTENFPPPTNTI